MSQDFSQSDEGRELIRDEIRDAKAHMATNDARRDQTVLALAGGSFLVSVTFLSDIAQSNDWIWVLFLSWGLLGLAIAVLLVGYQVGNTDLARHATLAFKALSNNAEIEIPDTSKWGRGGAFNNMSVVLVLIGMGLLGVFAVLNL